MFYVDIEQSGALGASEVTASGSSHLSGTCKKINNSQLTDNGLCKLEGSKNVLKLFFGQNTFQKVVLNI